VFEAITDYFLGRYTRQNLVKRYKNLTAMKDNLDVNQNEMSYEEALHPFRSSVCRRCFKYNCDLHKDDPKVYDPLPFRKIAEKTLLSPNDPCGDNCFLHIPGVSIPSSGSVPRTSKVDENQLASRVQSMHLAEESAQDKWTTSEKMMFRVLVKTLPMDFCSVAKALRTKDCNEVYKFSLTENNDTIRKESHFLVQEKQSGEHVVKKDAQKNKHKMFKSHNFGDDRLQKTLQTLSSSRKGL
jgi:hypothetical protein